MTEYWIDRLCHALAGHASRRQSLRLAALLTSSVVLAGVVDNAAAKPKSKKQAGKGKSKGNTSKGKGKGKPSKNKPGKGQKPAKPHPRPGHLGEPTGDDCGAFLGNNDPFVNDCRQAEQTCRAPDHFCIWYAEGDQPGPNDGATYSCCERDETCCLTGCADTLRDPSNCGACGRECGEGELCAGGYCVCVDTGVCCPRGSSRCPSDSSGCCADHPDHACCSDGCSFIRGADRNNCGGCGVTCARGQPCIDGECRCADGFKYCQSSQRCIREEYTCCGGRDHVIGYCLSGFICCGGDNNARCIYPWEVC
jgi:hypothetical protein